MDFNALLTDALSTVEKLRDRAAVIEASYRPETPEHDAAYQIWRDLDRAWAELDRTRYGIVEGLI